ncbi:hypothetical protein IDJ77_22455 [Mucilaginibacter sp. ZT4R22]|uniref:Uncharacterized protein n=1 Tax=Mucilaginibacter pankratovii TaxID=2772110 RepID=A0ABR7WWD1_9SPHI|nr:hypothetical protein [Mucilaginibacter pankratovii]MBD1366593.1 hypothetical protein [Mucilaginibacter pankratovii]
MKIENLKFAVFMLLIVFSTALNAAIPPKSQLKVLFVGYDPLKPFPVLERRNPGEMTKEGFLAEYPVRMPAFKALLSSYFTEVATMDCRDWKPQDSEPYDVTVFDFSTKVIEPARQEKRANGSTKYIPARYLPDNFSKPVVFIANTAPEMGGRIGLKLDWLCLCLDADAHHINTGHPIFKGSLEKVTPTMVMKATPDGVFHYTTGVNLPKQIPMWRVQKEGYLDRKDVRVGLVARGNRFGESPDAEVISSGVCTKDVGAVALGRHGNFFLWGFSASPADMTEEAKKVFVNTVAYMKGFDGKTPIARKYNDRMATTDDVREIIAAVTKEKYEEYVQFLKDFNEQSKNQKKLLDDKVATGQTLSPEEKESMTYLGMEQAIDSYEKYIKSTMGKLATRFGSDAPAFQKYMKENFGYLYCDPNAFFAYEVDDEAKQIGVSNHDVRFLETCINRLKKNEQPELALKMLKKYTAEDFSSSKEWRSWFAKNKNKLFFTETGGYKFLVNTYN